MSINQELDLGYIKIAGKFWGPEHGEPTLALHGYLDNANSFDMIAPHLKGLRVFAMDFAGHGWSAHRRDGEQYTGLNDMRDVLAVADFLGWESFNLIGHSMGAEIGSQLAGLFPERVGKLICIDGYCGTNASKEILAQLQSGILSSFKQSSTLKVFPSFEAMRTRLSEATGQNSDSADCLIRRGHKVVDGGYSWITDPRIRGSGPFELSVDQLDLLIESTTAKTLFIVADMENEWLKRSIEVVVSKERNDLELVHLPGHHHLHMQEQSGEVAELINNFADVEPQKLAS